MSVTKTVTDEYSFWNWLKKSDYKDNFSLEGAKAVFNYFDQLSEELGENVEFDPIAWCCEFGEYKSIDEAFDNYADSDKLENYEDKLSYFEDHTTVLQLENGGVVIAEF
jgi:hypothetical protein